MLNKQEILGQILKKNYPKTFQLLDEAQQKAIEDNSNTINSGIPSFEFTKGEKWDLDKTKFISKQFREYISGLGFWGCTVGEYPKSLGLKIDNKYYQGLEIKIWISEDKEVLNRIVK